MVASSGASRCCCERDIPAGEAVRVVPALPSPSRSLLTLAFLKSMTPVMGSTTRRVVDRCRPVRRGRLVDCQFHSGDCSQLPQIFARPGRRPRPGLRLPVTAPFGGGQAAFRAPRPVVARVGERGGAATLFPPTHMRGESPCLRLFSFRLRLPGGCARLRLGVRSAVLCGVGSGVRWEPDPRTDPRHYPTALVSRVTQPARRVATDPSIGVSPRGERSMGVAHE